jgi:hypothetical protein
MVAARTLQVPAAQDREVPVPAFKDADGDALSVEISAQPQDGKGSVAPLTGGGMQFVPPYKATGQSVFQVAATDNLGMSSGSVPIRVDMLGELLGGRWLGVWAHRCIVARAAACCAAAGCCLVGFTCGTLQPASQLWCSTLQHPAKPLHIQSIAHPCVQRRQAQSCNPVFEAMRA